MADRDTLYLLAFQIEECHLEKDGISPRLKGEVESLPTKELHDLCCLLSKGTREWFEKQLPSHIREALPIEASMRPQQLRLYT